MHKDKYRTSKREKRKGNCYCGDVSWSAKGGPHQASYCAKLRRQQYEDSLRECSEVLQPEATGADSERAGTEVADCPF